jgi:energy-coupling factor transporter ATP-binding protein EcfA2
MSFGLAIDKLRFSGGDVVTLPKSGMVLVVGPNNAGKSRLLKEIAGAVGAIERLPFVVLEGLSGHREGSADEFWSWLRGKYRVTENPDGTQNISGIGVGMGGGIRSALDRLWDQAPELGTFGRTFLSYLSTGTRLSDSNPVSSFDAISSAPDQPLQALYLDHELEERISKLFRSAFCEDLVLDRLGGTKLALRVGRRPPTGTTGPVSMNYALAVRALPTLYEQGDGMRSFVSCILHTEVLERPLVLVDEPETFLHPPQAARLAQHLAQIARTTARQVLVATHSSDIVRGVIDAGTDLAVIRLSRSAKGNAAACLSADAIKLLWKDPLLRASNLLDGLFHQRVVVCEADGDCRFLGAVLDAVCAVDGTTKQDVLFTHTGGKSRLAVAVSALRAVSVPVTVVADLDALSEEQPLRAIWEALGQNWDQVAREHRIVKTAVDATLRTPTVESLREKIASVLNDVAGAQVDERAVQAIRSATKAQGGWSHVKRAGVSAIPKGEARKACDTLLSTLAQAGLYLVPTGELEGFAPQIGGHGPKWLDSVLQLDLGRDLPEAAAFVRKLGIMAARTDEP